MNSIFKSLFSHRQGLIIEPSIITKESINQDVINAIDSCYDVLCKRLNQYYSDNYMHPWENFFYHKDIERELWIHFVNRRLAKFEENGRYHLVFEELLTQSNLPWNRILDLVEYVCKWISVNVSTHLYLDDFLKEFESSINQEFDRLDYGYRIVNHCVVDITFDVETETIHEAISESKDNVREHLQSAISHYSARPNPDVRNSIKESVSAVEAVCRELTGDDTLGKALKHLEERGVVIHKTLKDQFTKFYVYSNDSDSGIRHALMDDEGTYVPSKDEAYYMIVSCCAFVNYLRRKVGK